MIADPAFYLAAVVAVLIVGVSKGGFGGGLGLVGVPIMSLTISPVQAAAILLPILCLMDLASIRHYHGRWDGRNLRILLPAALAGIGIAAATYRVVDAELVRLLVGVIAVSFAAHFWLRRLRHVTPGPARGASPWRGGLWGAAAGFTSFVAHSAGPPLSVYLIPQRLERAVFAGTAVIFFTVVNLTKLVPYAWLGQFDATNLATALVLAPLAPIGVRLGVWLQRRVSDLAFYEVCYGLVFCAGLKLLWDVLA